MSILKTNDELLTDAINEVSPSVIGGGLKVRGPQATTDFVYQVWIAKALKMTDQLRPMLEIARTDNLQAKQHIDKYGKKGKFTDSKGWSNDGEFLWSFQIPKQLFFYFRKVVGPFLEIGRDQLDDPGSKFWKKMEKIIMRSDPVEIGKLEGGIRRKLYAESNRKIQSGYGQNSQESVV